MRIILHFGSPAENNTLSVRNMIICTAIGVDTREGPNQPHSIQEINEGS